ncbi:MAG: hypothetical protein N2645_23325 [Clostridia bacterium]|nr:hypothetical protein [Clostridia bacterium]
MKLLFYKVNSRKKDGRNFFSGSIERFLILLFIVSFSLLVIVQLALTDGSVNVLSPTDKQEVEAFSTHIMSQSSGGKITLTLLSGNRDGSLKILVNQEEIAVFAENSVDIHVEEGDIVEIDGTNSMEDAEVYFISKSANIKNSYKKVKIKNNVQKIMKVELDREV